MRPLALALVFTVASVLACPRPVPPPVPPTPDAADAGPATCASVCAHERAMRCPGGEPTPAGVACEDVCANAQQSVAGALNLDCMLRAASCAASDACPAP